MVWNFCCPIKVWWMCNLTICRAMYTIACCLWLYDLCVTQANSCQNVDPYFQPKVIQRSATWSRIQRCHINGAHINIQTCQLYSLVGSIGFLSKYSFGWINVINSQTSHSICSVCFMRIEVDVVNEKYKIPCTRLSCQSVRNIIMFSKAGAL